MLYKEAVSAELLTVLQTLCLIPELTSFRLVGGTAIALQMGHRRSIDIDFFSNEKIDMALVKGVLSRKFPKTQIDLTDTNIMAEVNGVRLELYHDWMMPFIKNAVAEEGIRMAALEDLAAFKLSAITGRREKKDYIDLFFLFRKFGAINVLQEFKKYDSLLSPKSLLFALTEINTAVQNKSPMPDMLLPLSWPEASKLILQAATEYLHLVGKNKI